jgi:hypothetical protein
VIVLRSYLARQADESGGKDDDDPASKRNTHEHVVLPKATAV